MDQNRLPLNLNFQRTQSNNAGQNFESDRTYPTNNERVYPTTPSTFPQPVFQSMHPGQQQDYLTAQMQSPTGQAYSAGGQGYFTNTSYQQYGQQGPYGGQTYQQSLTSPQGYSPRTLHANDPNAGLAQQFSTQNLGPQSRQNNYGRPSPLGPGSRSNTPHAGYHGSHLSPLSQAPTATEKPPEQDPSKFSNNVFKRVVGLHLNVEKFFTQNITRARERNVR